MNLLPFLFCFFIFIQLGFSQDYYDENIGKNMDYTFSADIKTVQLYNSDYDLSEPIIKLNNGQTLTLEFDELTSSYKQYTFSIHHCNSDWTISNLSPAEYMTGPTQEFISDYDLSYNTAIAYVHYSQKIPSYNSGFKIGGNYLVMVHENFNEENPILVKRFFVNEDIVKVDAYSTKATQVSKMNSHQQVNVTVTIDNESTIQPLEQLKIVIQQNGRWDNIIEDIKPTFIRGNQIIYDNPMNKYFEAGNEFRFLNIKDMRYKDINIESITFDGNNVPKIIIKPDLPRANQQYLTYQDINGKLLIKNDKGNDDDVESDYCKVKFILKSQKISNGAIYIYGEISSWTYLPEFAMNYNEETNSYEKELLLKQGYYNYLYSFKPIDENKGEVSVIEGSYKETENTYKVMIYQKKPNQTDVLIGIGVVNSVRN